MWLARARASCSAQADAIHSVKQQWRGKKGPSHMHDNQHGNALYKQSTGLRLFPSQPPPSTLIKRKSCQQLMWSPASRTLEPGFQSR